jgi:hypothetical protein
MVQATMVVKEVKEAKQEAGPVVEAVEAAALELLEVWVVKVEKVVVGINVAELILLLKDFPCYSIKYELLQ